MGKFQLIKYTIKQLFLQAKPCDKTVNYLKKAFPEGQLLRGGAVTAGD